jgi:hypothetical protein
MTWSAVTFVIGVRAGPYRELAERLEASIDGVRDPRYIARIERALNENDIFFLCSREIVRSAASIRLALLDVRYRDGEASGQQAALVGARDTLRRSLWCYPRDGNFWLRLAMVEFALVGPSADVMGMLRASLAAAASDAWVIVPRVQFASRLLGSELSGVEELLRDDVQNLVGYGRVSDVADSYVAVDEATRGTFRAAFEGLQVERLAAIEDAIARRVLPIKPEN